MRGLARQFWLMKEKSRCSILFHLLVPGGRWLTMMSRPSSVSQLLQLAFPQPHPRAVAAAAVRGDQQSGGLGIARPTDGAPPLPDAIDGERSRVMVNADTHPTRVGGEVIDPVRLLGHAFRRPLAVRRTRTASGLPCGRYSRPLLRKSPTSSFFLVSTEITGCLSAKAAPTWVLMWANCASRSGWLSPSVVLRLPCRL